MRNSSSRPAEVAAASESHSHRGFSGLGQQILNLLDVARQRAATLRALAVLTLRDLDDCGMTFADVEPEMPDMFANDFRVQHVATTALAA